jgi:hypothetical protein
MELFLLDLRAEELYVALASGKKKLKTHDIPVLRAVICATKHFARSQEIHESSITNVSQTHDNEVKWSRVNLAFEEPLSGAL